MKKKLNLQELSIKSFITTSSESDMETVRGGDKRETLLCPTPPETVFCTMRCPTPPITLDKGCATLEKGCA